MKNEYRVKTFKRYESELREKISNLQEEIDQKPASDYIQVQQDFAALLKENIGKQRLTKEFEHKLSQLLEREDKAKSGMKKYTHGYINKLIDEKISLEFELSDIVTQLYLLEHVA